MGTDQAGFRRLLAQQGSAFGRRAQALPLLLRSNEQQIKHNRIHTFPKLAIALLTMSSCRELCREANHSLLTGYVQCVFVVRVHDLLS